jgi:hypothetical protein
VHAGRLRQHRLAPTFGSAGFAVDELT